MTDAPGASASAARDPYATVLQVGTSLAASLDVDEVVQTIARQVAEALDVQWCDINEWDPVARSFTYVAVWSQALRGADLDYLGTVVSLDDRPERDAVLRKGDLLETYVDDPDLDPLERALMLEYEEKAVMEMPLVFAGETLGILGVVESRRDRRFTDEEKGLFRLLAGPAATALGNARLYRRQQTQARRLETLLRASGALAASVDLDQVLAGVARLAVEVTDVAYATVYEYRPHHDAIVYRAAHTLQDRARRLGDDPFGTVYRLADYPAERRILESAGAVQEHISAPDLPADRRATMEAWGQRSCLSIPLRTAGEPRGILRLTVTDTERDFSADELELAEAIAEVASAAVHNARLFRSQQEESDRLLRLCEVGRRFSPALERSAVAAALEEGAASLLTGVPRVRVWLRGDDDRYVRDGDDDGGPGELAMRALAGACVVEEVTVQRSFLAVPIVVRDDPEGVIVVEGEGYRRFWVAEREALQVLANQAAAALENERLYRRVEQEAVRDGLTGLYNHRHFQERLLQECRRARRYGTPLSLLLLDLDQFKDFNDRFGHQTGDVALREVGEILFAVTRRGVDLAARYGGEEFAVILPHTRAALAPREAAAFERDDPEAPPPEGAGALVVAERIREAVAGHAFPGHGGRRNARTTATVGVAELQPGWEAADLVKAADAALYEGKRRGRDRVAVDGG